MSAKDFRKAFDLYDLNHDGVISSSELKIVLVSFGYHASDQDVADVMADLDANHNGVIDYPEFVRLMETHPPKEGVVRTLDDTLLAFAAFDRDGNGVITQAELKAAMEVMGMALTEVELEAAMKEADVNGDGMINYAEFVRMAHR
jgi:calmodulin